MKFGVYRLINLMESPSVISAEKDLGVKISLLSFFRAWNRCNINDDVQWLASIFAAPQEILLTWEPWIVPGDLDKPEVQPAFSFRLILSGQYDQYIRSFAATLRNASRVIYLRPMHEMNGSWYPWCGTVNGNVPSEFLLVWRYLRKIFDCEGVTNVKWVWSPYAFSYPSIPENSIASYFPGDAEVDVLAIDGYNWGESTEWGTWISFKDLFCDAYTVLTSLSSKPIIIAETACAEQGGSKAEWISMMFRVLSLHFPQVTTVVWFDTNKECDWRISSSDLALNSFRETAGKFFV